MPAQTKETNKEERIKSWSESAINVVSGLIPWNKNDTNDEFDERDEGKENSHINKLKKNNRYLENKNKELRDKITKLENLLEYSKGLEVEVKELKEINEGAISRVRELSAENEALTRGWKNTRQELQGAKEHYEQHVDKISTQAEIHLNQIGDLKSKIDGYEDRIGKLNSELAKELLKNRSMSASLNGTLRSLNDLREENRMFLDLRAENERLKVQITELTTQRDQRPNITQADYDNLIREKEQEITAISTQKDNLGRSINDLMAENRRFQNDIIALTTERDAETARADNLQTQLNNANLNITSLTNENNGYLRNIIDARTILGIPLLKDLKPLPDGKTLSDLVDFFNNPPNCLNPLHNDYDVIKAERDNLQTELSTTQQERDNYKLQSENAEREKTELATKNKELEVKILNQIITECKLWDTEREREREREREQFGASYHPY